MSIATVLVSSLALYLAWHYVVQPAFFSPLSKIPTAHWSSSISDLWLCWQRCVQRENALLLEAHRKLGPIVRIAPRELSINTVDASFRQVYGSRAPYRKHDLFISIWCFGQPNCASMLDRAMHTERRKVMSGSYSRNAIYKNEALAMQVKEVINERLLPFLDHYALTQKPADMHHAMIASTTDIVTAFLFGISLSTNLVPRVAEAKKRMRRLHIRYFYAFFFQEYTWLWAWLSKIGVHVVPKAVEDAGPQIEEWIAEICDRVEGMLRTPGEAEGRAPEDSPVPYITLRTAILNADPVTSKEGGSREELLPLQRDNLYSEMVDACFGGFEVGPIPLCFGLYHLAKDQGIQERLHNAVSALYDGATAGSVPSASALEQVPLLEAIMLETLRLYPPLAGSLARTTPADETVTLCGYSGIPPNTRVSARCYVLHRNAEIFPEPESWRPDRWMTPDGSALATGPEVTEMHRWWWAFGSGSRQCLGLHLARYMDKAVLASVIARYRISPVEGDPYVPTPIDSFIGNLNEQKLDLKIERR